MAKNEDIIFENDDAFFKTASNIKSVSDYLNVLRYIRQQNPEKEVTYFFRGNAQIRKEGENEPSIYRKKENFIQHEAEIYHDMISRCPQDFIHCNTALDHLVMMQHYGAPTRLLDLSENPLVALYFACEKYNEEPPKNSTDKEKNTDFKDGKVSFFQVKNIEIKHYNSDTAAMLANLARAPIGFNIYILKMNHAMNFFDVLDFDKLYRLPRDNFKNMSMSLYDFLEQAKKILTSEIFNLPSDDSSDTEYVKSVKKSQKKLNSLFSQQIKQIDELIEKELSYNFEEKPIVAGIIKSLKYLTTIFRQHLEEQQHILRRFTHFIKEEKPYFDPELINFKHLESVICVKPKQDNPHIIRQNGAFFLFGVKRNSENKCECPPIPEKFKIDFSKRSVECIIPAASKQKILDELKSLSISKGYLFTDIDKVAEDVKEHYKTPISKQET